MLVGWKTASAKVVAFVWAMTVVFALCPVLSSAILVPVGVFAQGLVHSHEHGDEHHTHYGHHHHHQHDVVDQHHDDDVDSEPDREGLLVAHVHVDAGCPCLDLPVLPTGLVNDRAWSRMEPPPVEAMQGAPPDRLLRPPIT
jgi:hypothetical protein